MILHDVEIYHDPPPYCPNCGFGDFVSLYYPGQDETHFRASQEPRIVHECQRCHHQWARAIRVNDALEDMENWDDDQD